MAKKRKAKVISIKQGKKKKAARTTARKGKAETTAAKIREAVGPLYRNGKWPERQAVITACVKNGVPEEKLSHHSVQSVKDLLARG